jgi:hypothetical protein
LPSSPCSSCCAGDAGAAAALDAVDDQFDQLYEQMLQAKPKTMAGYRTLAQAIAAKCARTNEISAPESDYERDVAAPLRAFGVAPLRAWRVAIWYWLSKLFALQRSKIARVIGSSRHGVQRRLEFARIWAKSVFEFLRWWWCEALHLMWETVEGSI